MAEEVKERGHSLKRTGKFYVYIVECSDGTYYTGYTNDLEKRIGEHNYSKRRAKYLNGRTPVKLIYAKEYTNYKNAIKAELDIKKRTRLEKEAMIKAYKNKTMSFAPLFCQPMADKTKRGADSQRCAI